MFIYTITISPISKAFCLTVVGQSAPLVKIWPDTELLVYLAHLVSVTCFYSTKEMKESKQTLYSIITRQWAILYGNNQREGE